MTPRENELIRESLRALGVDRRDNEGWRAIIRLSFPIALATANRILRGNLDLAKEASWQAFARIARYADFQLLSLMEPGAFLRYLKQITRRTSYDLLRLLARFSPEVQSDLSLLDETFQSNAPTPEQTLQADELRAEIVAILDPLEQRLLNLVLEGFSLTEMGEGLGISYVAAGVRLHRLREKIRNYLKDQGLL